MHHNTHYYVIFQVDALCLALAIDAPPQRLAILSRSQTLQPLRSLTMTEELNKELIYSRMKIIYDAWAVCPTTYSLLWQLTSLY